MEATERERIGRAWLESGLEEHASVASFARFVLELMELAAPPELLLAAIDAMKDEVRHATLCFGIASRFTNRAVGPGGLNLSGALECARPRAAILEGAILEGCVNESIACGALEVAVERAVDPGIRRVLREIVDDERRHAELAWDFVEWMVEGDERLRPTAARCFERALASPAPAEGDDLPAVAEQYGHLLEATRREIRKDVLENRIAPRAVALVGGPLSEVGRT